MNKDITHITKVGIQGLWNRYDLEWNLNPDVNVLSGINGSGKSTILDCLTDLLVQNILLEKLNLIDSIIITFNNSETTLYATAPGLSISEDSLISIGLSSSDENKKVSNDLYNSFKLSKGIVLFNGALIKKDDLLIATNIYCYKISTFDTLIQGERPDEKVITNLDRDLFYLEKKFLNYKLNVGNRAFEAVNDLDSSSKAIKEVAKIRKQLDRFLDIIDSLFANTDKKINRKKNEISFLSGEDELTPYQLSSGEKQMLVILLTVLVQDNKPSILFMDEPEISLHFDWQKKLIGYIRELNPTCQVILATHSPAVVMEGWTDKVVDVKDLITLDRLAVVK